MFFIQVVQSHMVVIFSSLKEDQRQRAISWQCIQPASETGWKVMTSATKKSKDWLNTKENGLTKCSAKTEH